jgi:hypothetical protein
MRSLRWILCLASVWSCVGVQTILAAPGDFSIDKNLFFKQTSGSQPTIADGWQFSAMVLVANRADMNAAQLTPPGGSALPMTGSSVLQIAPTFFNSLANLDAAFPDGSYVFKPSGGTLSGGTASLTMPDNTFYPAEVPSLSGSSYTSLQAYNPSQSLQLTWNSFTPDARTTFPFVDFFIEELVNGEDTSTALQTSTFTNVSSFTSATIPAATLLPNQQYQAVLVFENDVQTNDAYFGTYNTDIQKEYFTDIDFTTAAVPEPSSIVLLAAGVIGACVFVARRRKHMTRALFVP